MKHYEIEEDQIYFNYGPNFPRKVLSIKNGEVTSVDVSYQHHFYVYPCATRYQSSLLEFANWAEIRLTTIIINKKAV